MYDTVAILVYVSKGSATPRHKLLTKPQSAVESARPRDVDYATDHAEEAICYYGLTIPSVIGQ